MIRPFSLDHQAVITSAGFSSRDALLASLAERAAHCYGVPGGDVEKALRAREKLGSTGFGEGIAIPHGKVAGLERPVGLFVRLDEPLPFDAVDGLPVDLVFCLVSPEGAGADHLKALAHASRMMRDEKWVATLRGATDADAMYAVLTGRLDRHAA